jgi:hypothetical protein
MKKLAFLTLLLSVAWAFRGNLVLVNESGEARAIRLGERFACEMVFIAPDGTVYENTSPCYMQPGWAMQWWGLTESGTALMPGAGWFVTMNACGMRAYYMSWYDWEEAHKADTLPPGEVVECD